MNRILRGSRHGALAAIAVLVAAASLVSFGESYRGLYDWASRHGLPGAWAIAWPVQVDSFIAVGELALFVALADGWRMRSRLGAWAVTAAGLAVSVAGNIGHIASHDLASRATAAVPPLAAAAALAVGLGVLKRVVGAHPAGADETADMAAVAAQVAAGALMLAAELRVPLDVPEPESVPEPYPARPARPADDIGLDRLEAWLTRAGNGVPAVPEPPASLNGHGRQAAGLFASELARGEVPSIRAIRSGLSVGQDRAQQVQAYLRQVRATPAGQPPPDHASSAPPVAAGQRTRMSPPVTR